MSSIDKLSIQGIRSFSPEAKQEIYFGTPLTLIVGANGCGKTTIIECLKYSTTGDMPPNSKGGAFVFDPKMKGSREVSAQVRLFLRATDQRKYSITRNLQTILKGKTQSFKTLESDIGRLENDGTVTTMSSRAQNLDERVPKFLGVSKAILEYVIFTHQEDSLWPLSEPAVLKKRFDEIFQVFKFSKSVDLLKSFKKESVADCKILQETVNYLKTDRNRSQSTKLKISQLQKKINQYEESVTSLKVELDDIIAQQDKLFKSNQEYQQVLSKLETLENKKNLMISQMTTLKQNLTNTIENKSIQELQHDLQNFEAILLSKEQEIEDYKKNHLEPKLQELEMNRKLYNELIGKQGEYNQMIKEYELNKEKLQEMEIMFKADFNLEPKTEIISSHLKRLKTSYQVFKNTNESELSFLQEKASELGTQSKVEMGNLNFINNDILRTTNTLKVLEKDLQKIMKNPLNDEKRQADIQKSFDDFKQQLVDFEESETIKKISQQIDNEFEQISHLETSLENIQGKIMASKKQSDLLINYNLVKQDLQKAQEFLAKSLFDFVDQNKKMDNVLDLADIDKFKPTLEHCKEVVSIYENSMDDAEILSASSNQKYRGLENEHGHSIRAHKAKVDEIRDTENQLAKLKSFIDPVLPIKEINKYSEQVSELEETEKELLEGIKAREVFGQFFQKSKDIAEVSKCCFLCERTFKNDEQGFEKFIARLNSKLKIDVEDFVQEKTYVEQKLANLKKLAPSIQTFNEKQHFLVILKKDLTNLEGNLQNPEKELGKSKTEYDRAVSFYDKLKKLRTFVLVIERLIATVESQTFKLNELNRDVELKESNTENYESLDALNTKQSTMNNELKQMRKNLYELQTTKENQTRTYNKLQQYVKDQGFTLAEIETMNLEKNKISNDIAEQKKTLENFAVNKKMNEETVSRLQKSIQTTNQALVELKDKYQTEGDTLQKKLDEFTRISDLFQNLNDLTKTFEQNHQKKSIEVSKQVETADLSIKQLDSEIVSINQHINAELAKVNDSKTTKNNIRFNIEYQELNISLAKVTKEISEIDVQNAQVKRNEYEKQALELKHMYEQVSSENASKVGEIKQLRNQIAEMTHLLNTEYKGIDQKYMESLASLQSKTLKNADLDEYSKLIEMSIIKYHATKMKEINRVLDELWRSTYVGSDITTIMIKTEQVTSARGRSYNYKVVMFKDGYELDMRGRCSAGQKVLASILIRLALSESFGSDCGVIALDEPTTNLDEDNIASLAQGLHNIIQARQHQRNFQIIIITHDEKFLRYMKASDFADGYFKVDRDSLSTSTISWIDIKNIYE